LIKSVIFDFGGVLAKPIWSTEKVVDIIARELLNYGIQLPTGFLEVFGDVLSRNMRKATCSMIEIPFEKIVIEALDKFGIVIDNSLAYEIMMRVSNAKLHEFRPDAQEILRELKSLGLIIGVLSNTSLFIPKMSLERIGLSKFVDAIILSREVGFRKPHQAIFSAIINRLKINPKETLFIGDVLEIDVYGAKRAGMLTALMSEMEPVYKDLRISFDCLDIKDKIEPDYRINSLSEVLDIVKEINKIS